MEKNYEIVEEIAILGTNPKSNWTKELNKVSWYGRDPKYDIRDWAPGREKYGKGVTLSEDEFSKLVEFCKSTTSLEGLDI